MRGLAGAAPRAAARRRAPSSVTSVSNSWLWRSGLASVAANRLSARPPCGPSELNSTSGSVCPASRMRAASVAPSMPGMCMSRMARSKALAPASICSACAGRLGVLRHHAPLGGLQRQDAPVGGVVVDHQHALALERRLLADEVAPACPAGSAAGGARDREVEGRARPGPGALGPHRAAHQLGQQLADRQAQARCRRTCAWCELSAWLNFWNSRLMPCSRQADAGVAHGEVQQPALGTGRSAPPRRAR